MGRHYIDGIQEALEGSSEVRKVWYNDSLLYTSREARAAAINGEVYARAGTPSQPKHSQHPVAAARPNSDDATYHHNVPDCLESIYEEEEDLGDASLA